MYFIEWETSARVFFVSEFELLLMWAKGEAVHYIPFVLHNNSYVLLKTNVNSGIFNYNYLEAITHACNHYNIDMVISIF